MDRLYKDGNIHSKQQLLKDWNFRNIERVVTGKKRDQTLLVSQTIVSFKRHLRSFTFVNTYFMPDFMSESPKMAISPNFPLPPGNHLAQNSGKNVCQTVSCTCGKREMSQFAVKNMGHSSRFQYSLS